MISTTELDQLLREHEDHHLEFKRARNEFNLEKLINYSVALANEGGGRLVHEPDFRGRDQGEQTAAELCRLRRASSLALH